MQDKEYSVENIIAQYKTSVDSNEQEKAAENSDSLKDDYTQENYQNSAGAANKDNTGDNKEDEKNKFNLKKEIFDWVDSVVFSVIFVVVLFTFVFKVVTVEGRSMTNTLQDGDRLVISNMFYTPSYGDIVVLVPKDSPNDRFKEKPLIKRIIATGGQSIELKLLDNATYSVYVDGKQLSESYIKEDIVTDLDLNGKTVNVPKGYLFVMGDNRNGSEDSRSDDIGLIKEEYVLGRVIFRVYPFKQIEKVK